MKLTTLRHIARARKDQTPTLRVTLWRTWQAIGGLKEIPCTGVMLCTMRIKACAAKVSDDWICSRTRVYVCLRIHEYAFIHYYECPMEEEKAPVLANKHFSIVDSSSMTLLVNLSAFDSKPLEAIMADKWKLYMKINIKSFVREKIILLEINRAQNWELCCQ